MTEERDFIDTLYEYAVSNVHREVENWNIQGIYAQDIDTARFPLWSDNTAFGASINLRIFFEGFVLPVLWSGSIVALHMTKFAKNSASNVLHKVSASITSDAFSA